MLKLSESTAALRCAIIFASTLVAGFAAPVQAMGPAEKAAAVAASDWLYMVDQGQLEQAWSDALVARNLLGGHLAWAGVIADQRRQLGPVQKRILRAKFLAGQRAAQRAASFRVQTEVTALSGAEAREVLTIRRNDDAWTVIGYHFEAVDDSAY